MRVLVAMSGGVDSSVVAALLHEQGHEVVGATLQLYDHGAAIRRKGACCAGEDIHDAREVAARLGIAHYVLDREERFRDAVIAPFAASYAAGETPIPCIRCNQTVKFHDLTELADDLGCEALATGHYARRLDGPDGAELHCAADPLRDQSYFLGHTTRRSWRAACSRWAPWPPRRRCAPMRRGSASRSREAGQPGHLLRARGQLCRGGGPPPPRGDAARRDRGPGGPRPGQHRGIGRYTVGQGRGLGVSGPERLYVAALDVPRRRVVVAHARRSARPSWRWAR
jgi:tRNA-specific 2-thiouridylase